MKNVLVLTGAGQIGLAIVRRIGSGMKIVVSDKNAANAASAALLLFRTATYFFPFAVSIFLTLWVQRRRFAGPGRP